MTDTNAGDTAAPINTTDTPQAPATATVDVPAQHESLIQRAVELLKSGESWIADNIEAGVTTLEKMLKGE